MTYQPEIIPAAQGYYDRETVEDAVATAKEMVEEWDYAADPHGYCHVRPVLVRLVQAVEAAGSHGGDMTGNIRFCFGPGTSAPPEVSEDSGISREAWNAMSEAEQDEAVQGWMPARSGVAWVEET